MENRVLIYREDRYTFETDIGEVRNYDSPDGLHIAIKGYLVEIGRRDLQIPSSTELIGRLRVYGKLLIEKRGEYRIYICHLPVVELAKSD